MRCGVISRVDELEKGLEYHGNRTLQAVETLTFVQAEQGAKIQAVVDDTTQLRHHMTALEAQDPRHPVCRKHQFQLRRGAHPGPHDGRMAFRRTGLRCLGKGQRYSTRPQATDQPPKRFRPRCSEGIRPHPYEAKPR